MTTRRPVAALELPVREPGRWVHQIDLTSTNAVGLKPSTRADAQPGSPSSRANRAETLFKAMNVVRRLTEDPGADPPNLEPGPAGPFRVLVDTGPDDAWAFAERQRDECADELGIAEPWKLVTVPRPG
jgi:hypothetical protein